MDLLIAVTCAYYATYYNLVAPTYSRVISQCVGRAGKIPRRCYFPRKIVAKVRTDRRLSQHITTSFLENGQKTACCYTAR